MKTCLQSVSVLYNLDDFDKAVHYFLLASVSIMRVVEYPPVA